MIVVSPHPDDEMFGCAGLMSRSIAEGKQVKLIIMTGGGKSLSGCCIIIMHRYCCAQTNALSFSLLLRNGMINTGQWSVNYYKCIYESPCLYSLSVDWRYRVLISCLMVIYGKIIIHTEIYI